MTSVSRLLSLAAAAAALTALLSGCGKSRLPEPVVTPPVAVAPGDNVADGDVTMNVLAALQQDASLTPFNIEAFTLKGDVRLVGVVDTQAQKDSAVALARAAKGAHTIHDELTVKPKI